MRLQPKANSLKDVFFFFYEKGTTFDSVKFTQIEGKLKCRPMHFIFLYDSVEIRVPDQAFL